MTKEDFIKKWNIAFESKEQEFEFATEMNNDLSHLSNESKPLDVEGLENSADKIEAIKLRILDEHRKHKDLPEWAYIAAKKIYDSNFAVVSPLVNTEELKTEFAIKCTELNPKGMTIIKGTPMDIWNWFLPHIQPHHQIVNAEGLSKPECSVCWGGGKIEVDDYGNEEDCTWCNGTGIKQDLQPKQPVVNTLPTDEDINKAVNNIETEWTGQSKVSFARGMKYFRDNFSIPLQQGEDTKSEAVEFAEYCAKNYTYGKNHGEWLRVNGNGHAVVSIQQIYKEYEKNNT